MAKANGPLFSLNASGSIKKNLTFSQRKPGQKVRKYNKPTGKASAKQRARRRLMEFIVAQWQGMTDAEKLTWQENQDAKKLGITGYQFFVKECQRDLATYHGLKDYFDFNTMIENKLYSLIDNQSYFTASTPGYGTVPYQVNSFSKKFDKGILFDGVGGYLFSNTTNWNDLANNNFFIECWIKLQALYPEQYIIYTSKTSPARTFYVKLDTDGIYIYLKSGANEKNLQATMFIDDDKWYCMQVIVDRSDKLRLFINGEEAVAGVDITNITGSLSTGEQLQIGKTEYSMKGIADEFALYWRVPTDEELARRYFFGRKNQKR